MDRGGAPKAAVATCAVLATACVLSLLHRRKRRAAPAPKFVAIADSIDLEQSNTGTGPISEAGSETGRSSPFAPYEPYEPTALEPDLAATDERWLATTERIVMVHEGLRVSAAKEATAQQHALAREVAGLEASLSADVCHRTSAATAAAAQLSALKQEVAQLEAALHASEARRAHDARQWRSGLAWLLATGQLTVRRWDGNHRQDRAVGGQ